ncbi:MAG: ribose 5-phosphate isomerase B [Chitinophagales bacterium]
MKKIAIGSDHAGYELKEFLKPFLEKKAYEIIDKGCHSLDSVDYPDFAHAVALSVKEKEVDFGILICGSGNGISMAANKHQDIRAAIAWLPEIAALAKQHNNANILSLPARFISNNDAKNIIEAYLSTEFEGGRHQRRVDKVAIC